MSYLWPQALWLLLAVPALVALYVLLLRGATSPRCATQASISCARR
jgi:hypothetical protein